MKQRTITWRIVGSLILMCLSLITPARTVSANNETVVLNPDGGTGADDGLKVSVGFGGYQIMRNGVNNLFYDTTWGPALGWTLTVAENNLVDCLYAAACNSVTASGGTTYDSARFTNTTTQVSATQARTILTAAALGGTRNFTLTVDSIYIPNRATVDIAVKVEHDAGYTGPLHLYLGGDVIFDGQDYGPLQMTEFQGKPLLTQVVDSGSYGGIRQSGTPFTSYLGAYWDCAYGGGSQFNSSSCETYAGMIAGKRGQTYGEPYPDFVNSAVYDTLPTIQKDAGLGAHWDLRALDTLEVTTQLFIAGADQFEAWKDQPDPNDPVPTPAPAVTPEPVCDLQPDIAVSPAEITLVPGGRAQIEIAMRNRCPSAVYSGADLLMSFSDGLKVVGTDGQRFSLRNLSLAGGETKRWTVEVIWDELITPNPVHITELYRGGRVTARIDGIFIVPPGAAGAADAVSQTGVADASAGSTGAVTAPTAVVAPLPATLPNTSSGSTEPMVIWVVLAVALLAGSRLLRVRR
jgi:hypothetical protein